MSKIEFDLAHLAHRLAGEPDVGTAAQRLVRIGVEVERVSLLDGVAELVDEEDENRYNETTIVTRRPIRSCDQRTRPRIRF